MPYESKFYVQRAQQYIWGFLAGCARFSKSRRYVSAKVKVRTAKAQVAELKYKLVQPESDTFIFNAS